jgi:hypothetical protein
MPYGTGVLERCGQWAPHRPSLVIPSPGRQRQAPLPAAPSCSDQQLRGKSDALDAETAAPRDGSGQ